MYNGYLGILIPIINELIMVNWEAKHYNSECLTYLQPFHCQGSMRNRSA